MSSEVRTTSRRYGTVKRTIDVVLSLLVLLVTAPLQAAVAIAVALGLGRPVLFRQERPGLHGVPFTIVKFRTMRDFAPDLGLASDAERMTPLGAALRSTSLDELPTLVNVLKGDMSLVGPRPLLMQYLDRYTAEQASRHEVRPGMTGLAQVSGRNAITWEQKLAADAEYVRRRSLRLDFEILLRTVIFVVRRSGISSPGEVTMSEFRGSSSAEVRL